eukprot:17846-Alexandrium_andersonii.AAC.1
MCIRDRSLRRSFSGGLWELLSSLGRRPAALPPRLPRSPRSGRWPPPGNARRRRWRLDRVAGRSASGQP